MLRKSIKKFDRLLSVASILVILTLITEVRSSEVCNAKLIDNDPHKIVCVCNEQSCPDMTFKWPTASGESLFVTSTRSGKRLKVLKLPAHIEPLKSHNLTKVAYVSLNLSKERQKVLGWGGAFTDAAGSNLLQLSEKLAYDLLNSYFGENGLQYNWARVPIGGTDFSSRAYSYDDSPRPDYELKNWTLAREDQTLKIPFILQAKSLVQKSNVSLNLLASPWTPPRWMKSNNNFVRGSLIEDEKTYSSYANYLMKFYEAYEKKGIKFWGATVQNEPVSSFNPLYYYNSVHFTNGQMIKFISQYLGPVLEAHGYTKENFKLLVGDDPLGLVNIQVPPVMRNKDVQKYVSGFAFHWYTSGYIPYDALTRLYEAVKNHTEYVIMSEACTGSVPGLKKVDPGSWDRGEAYAADIIEDFARNTQAWIDWNLTLDMNGGPNWSGNFVDSPILIDSRKNEFYKQPMYYALAHFSRFFKPDSIVLETEVNIVRSHSHRLLSIAAINKQSGHVVVNLLNKSLDPIKINLNVEGLEHLENELVKDKIFLVEPKSITSVILKI